MTLVELLESISKWSGQHVTGAAKSDYGHIQGIDISDVNRETILLRPKSLLGVVVWMLWILHHFKPDVLPCSYFGLHRLNWIFFCWRLTLSKVIFEDVFWIFFQDIDLWRNLQWQPLQIVLSLTDFTYLLSGLAFHINRRLGLWVHDAPKFHPRPIFARFRALSFGLWALIAEQ